MQQLHEVALCPLSSDSYGAEKNWNYGIAMFIKLYGLVNHARLLVQGRAV